MPDHAGAVPAWRVTAPTLPSSRPVSSEIYPLRRDERLGDADYAAHSIVGHLAGYTGPMRSLRLRLALKRALRAAARISELSDADLDREIAVQRRVLAKSGLAGRPLAMITALVRETLNRELGMRPYDVQVYAALGLLDGNLVEMATGEGKSIVATLAAALAALARRPTHVVTVNDYLAARDAEEMAPLFRRLGLSVGCITHEASPAERREIYGRDIVYASNKEIAFDYLRDQLKIGQQTGPIQMKLHRLNAARTAPPVMRGLYFAIVDEADSVLIDDARTPLILSQETDVEAELEWATTAHRLADRIFEGPHFTVDDREKRIELTEAGKERLADMAAQAGPIWQNKVQREQAVRSVLVARRYFRNGDQYVVQDGKVVIVDEYTGRLMPERSWNDGLHQLVEFSEGVDITSRKVAIARTTYQKFFRKYLRLSGMSGTAREVRGEVSAVFRLVTVRLPTRLPTRLRWLGTKTSRHGSQKDARVADRISELTAAGRPVLVGTRTVVASEAISATLTRRRIAHDVLSAVNDRDEAEIIARAGAPGNVTVATNMAGRGVHISISDEVQQAGGLHVILTERHDSARIDRQLVGRTARQGQPGSAEAILALDDQLLKNVRAPVLRRLSALGGPVGQIAARLLFRRAQRRAEKRNVAARRALLKHDRGLDRLLAFSGNLD
jgi:preprotein translocase subunit SecA